MQKHLCVYIIQLHRLICKTADGVKREAEAVRSQAEAVRAASYATRRQATSVIRHRHTHPSYATFIRQLQTEGDGP